MLFFTMLTSYMIYDCACFLIKKDKTTLMTAKIKLIVKTKDEPEAAA